MDNKENNNNLQPTPWYFYVLALMFCIVFVLCITFLAWKMDNAWLMLFYVLPVVCFAGL